MPAGGAKFYTVRSERKGGASKELYTRRRFDDLVALHENVKIKFRGCIIPPRPGKTILNSTLLRSHGDEFLMDRAAEMQAYLQQISCHKEIGDSEARPLLSSLFCLGWICLSD